LELGCGAGLPGLTALYLKKASDCMHFCDYNRSVLVETTWPTIYQNLHNWNHNNSNISCYAGDWSDVSDYLLADSDSTKYCCCYSLCLFDNLVSNMKVRDMTSYWQPRPAIARRRPARSS